MCSNFTFSSFINKESNPGLPKLQICPHINHLVFVCSTIKLPINFRIYSQSTIARTIIHAKGVTLSCANWDDQFASFSYFNYTGNSLEAITASITRTNFLNNYHLPTPHGCAENFSVRLINPQYFKRHMVCRRVYICITIHHSRREEKLIALRLIAELL